jgi:hypothetical protein
MYTTDVSTHTYTQRSLARIQGGKSDPSNPIKPNTTTQGHGRMETPAYGMDVLSQYNVSSGAGSMNNECCTCSNYPLLSICLSRSESHRTGGKPTHGIQSNRLELETNFIPTKRLFSRDGRMRSTCVGVGRHVTQCKLTSTSLLNTPLLYWRIWLNRMLKGCWYVLSPTSKETSYSDRRFWISYILFIIMIGGILVLYIYIYM